MIPRLIITGPKPFNIKGDRHPLKKKLIIKKSPVWLENRHKFLVFSRKTAVGIGNMACCKRYSGPF